jgi:SAM-dependent methyltransferase
MEPTIDQRATAQVTGLIGQWDQGALCLAALAVAADRNAAGGLAAAAHDVMAAAGLADVLASPERLPFSPAQLSGMAAAPVLQAATVLSGGYDSWAAQSDSALIAQGRASGSTAALFAAFVLPRFDGLADRLGRPGARMLDVGTGVGALAAGFARMFPDLHVTGLDVMPRVLDIARTELAATPVASRVEFRRQSVEDLTDEVCYDLAWIPAPFVPEPALRTGIARMVAALRPGGVLMVGHGNAGGADLADAITRFKTAVYGGTPLDGASARRLLGEHGLTSVQTVATPPGAPSLTAGQN